MKAQDKCPKCKNSLTYIYEKHKFTDKYKTVWFCVNPDCDWKEEEKGGENDGKSNN